MSDEAVAEFNKNVELWVKKYNEYKQQVKRTGAMDIQDKKLMSSVRKEEHICEVLGHARNLLERSIRQIEGIHTTE